MTYNPALSYTTAHATIACRGYGDSADRCEMGNGNYVSKAYNARRVAICTLNGVTLYEITDTTTRYEIYWDGELVDRYTKRTTAISYTADFAGVSVKAIHKIIDRI